MRFPSSIALRDPYGRATKRVFSVERVRIKPV
jgi:hypothetical protein